MDEIVNNKGDNHNSTDDLWLMFLMGDMTIVGPRPHMILQTKKYNQKIHNFKERHSEKPDINGFSSDKWLSRRNKK